MSITDAVWDLKDFFLIIIIVFLTNIQIFKLNIDITITS